MRKQFGDRLKELRTEKLMTQEELAKLFNTGKASISNYESNNRLPDANTISKYASYFGVSVDYLLGISENRNNTIDLTMEKLKRFIEDHKDYVPLIVKMRKKKIDTKDVDRYIDLLILEQEKQSKKTPD